MGELPVATLPYYDSLVSGERLGALVRRYRKMRGLNQTEAAALAGTDQSSMSEIELGIREPGSDIMARIAHALRIPHDEMAEAYGQEMAARLKVRGSQADAREGAAFRKAMREIEERRRSR